MHVCLTLSLYGNICFSKELGFTSQSPSLTTKAIGIVCHCCPTSWLLAALTDSYVWLTGFWKGREHFIHRVKSLPGDVIQCITVLWNGGLTCCCVLNSSSSCRDEFTVSQNKREEISSGGYYKVLRTHKMLRYLPSILKLKSHSFKFSACPAEIHISANNLNPSIWVEEHDRGAVCF